MDRRDFLKGSAMATAALMFDWEKAFAAGANAPAVGKVWKGWKPGSFRIDIHDIPGRNDDAA